MLKRIFQFLALAVALTPALSALHIKVLAVDYKSGQITLLLPMHNTRLEAKLTPEEPEIRVRINQFYEAAFETGRVDTVKRNVLRIEVPDQHPVRFRIRKITFIEK